VGPATTFAASTSTDPNKWFSSATLTIQYSATDTGAGVIDHYEYTHDDIKTVADPRISGQMSANETSKAFAENVVNKDGQYAKYVFVRAVDSLGNAGNWTINPAYLNMDTVAPNAPTINATAQVGNKVTVGFGFADGTSPKPSGFQKYSYKLDTNGEQPITTQNGTFDITNTTSTAATHSVTAWAFDNAGNKSAPATKTGISVLPLLKVNCPKSSIEQNEKIVCSLDSSTSQVGVKLECYNNGTFVRTFTTTSSDKTIYCKPSKVGTMTIKASKSGWMSGESAEVKVTAGSSSGDDSGGSSTTKLTLNCPSTASIGTSATITTNTTVNTDTWDFSATGVNMLSTQVRSDGKGATISLSNVNIATTITVSATAKNGTKDSCTIAVKGIQLTNCAGGTKTMTVGSDTNVAAAKVGSISEAFSYTSSKTGIATVNGTNGLIHAVAPGQTTITAKAGSFSRTCVITVQCAAGTYESGGHCYPGNQQQM
jgi:hypothetical protein